MLYLLLFEVVKLLFGDDVEDVNDEFNREDIGDMLILCGVMFGFDFLLLVGVRLLVFFGYFFEVKGDINFGDDGGVIFGDGREGEEDVDIGEIVGDVGFGIGCLGVLVFGSCSFLVVGLGVDLFFRLKLD